MSLLTPCSGLRFLAFLSLGFDVHDHVQQQLSSHHIHNSYTEWPFPALYSEMVFLTPIVHLLYAMCLQVPPNQLCHLPYAAGFFSYYMGSLPLACMLPSGSLMSGAFGMAYIRMWHCGPVSACSASSRWSTGIITPQWSIFLSPQSPFPHIHHDLVGPFPVCNSYCHLFTVSDRFLAMVGSHPLCNLPPLKCMSKP